jgi:DNA topoisomerase-3
MNYVCEKSVGPEKTCDFRSGKVILQQEISPEQITQLLQTGKTSLLEGFISSRTNRKFKAYLALGEGGKVGFEFEVRTPKAGKTATKTATKAASKIATKASTKTAKKAATKTAKKAAVKTASKTAAKTATKAAAKKAPAKKAAARKKTPSDS